MVLTKRDLRKRLREAVSSSEKQLVLSSEELEIIDVYFGWSHDNGHIQRLCENFGHYLRVFDKRPLDRKMLKLHRSTMDKLKDLGSVNEAVLSEDFLDSVRETLVAFGQHSRRAMLKSEPEFISQFRKHCNSVIRFQNYSLADIPDNPEIIDDLWDTIWNLQLAVTGSQIVPGSKALHHLLPSLLPPIDHTYTQKFFQISSYKFDNKQIEAMRTVMTGFVQIHQCLERRHGKKYLSSLIDDEGWHTSETKLIDNAIIGYVKKYYSD